MDSHTSDNLFADLPEPGAEEHFETLFASQTVRVERIVSDGQASPPDFWFDQADDEWVMVVRGEAVIEFADGSRQRMCAGDWLVLPAGRRHRVAETTARTLWLAVHATTR